MRKRPVVAALVPTFVLIAAFGVAALAQTTVQTKPPDTQAQIKPTDPKAQAKPGDPKQAPPQSPAKSPVEKTGLSTVQPIVPANVPPPPPDYVIGPDDVLQVLFWREKENSAEVVVRPDGMISLPMLNDIKAGGLTPEELRLKVVAEAKRFIVEPEVSVVVKTINSRRVFITGQVGKPGAYALGAPTTVLQLIALAGGLGDFAKQTKISVMRVENGKPVSYKFNYKEVTNGKNLKQNILLKPGDTVIVP